MNKSCQSTDVCFRLPSTVNRQVNLDHPSIFWFNFVDSHILGVRLLGDIAPDYFFVDYLHSWII